MQTLKINFGNIKIKVSFVLLIIILLVVFYCSKFSPTQPSPTTSQVVAPEIEIVNESLTYSPGDTIQIKAISTDDLTKNLLIHYQWRLLNLRGGLLLDSDSPITYFIPFQAGEFVIGVIAIANGERSEEAFLNIIISAPDTADGNPTAKIMASDTVAILGQSVKLDGSKSSDPQNDPLLFEWKNLNGGSLSTTDSSIVYFTTTEAGSFIITLKVSDGAYESSLSYIRIRFDQGSPPAIIVEPFDSVLATFDSLIIDVTQSFDPDEHAITFYWRTLNGGSINPTNEPVVVFKPDRAGSFVINLKVEDEFGFHSSKLFNITVLGSIPTDEIPTASIVEANKTIRVTESVWLDGSYSSDPNDDPLTYRWEAIDGGMLEHADSVLTQFRADKAGIYVISLVVSDGTYFSEPALARITVTANQLPKANAGEDQVLRLGENATLNGGQSFDPEGKAITYQWEALNGGLIENSTSPITTFSADIPGTYTISLVVNDGLDNSEPDMVNITFQPNQHPIARAGSDDTSFVNVPIILDGSRSSDPDNDQITFFWEPLNGGFISEPGQAVTTFEADNASSYAISLTVFDGYDWSFADIVTITVLDTTTADTISLGLPPVANAGRDTTYLFGEKVALDGSQSYDPQGLDWTFHWISVETNPASITLPNVAMPEFTPPQPGSYVFILYIDNGLQLSAPDQVKIEIAEPDITVSKTKTPDYIKIFPTIETGLDGAQEGDMIFVEKGEYQENVSNFISNITLLSTDRDHTIINGRGIGSTLHLRSVSGVTICGFKIIEGGRSDPLEIDVACITCSENSSNIVVADNYITKSYGDGVRLYYVTNVELRNNEISNNMVNGIRSSTSSFDVYNCTFENNGKDMVESTGGISVETHGGGDMSAITIQIQGNTFRDNEDYHLQLSNNSRIFVEDNLFTGVGGAIYSTQLSGVQLTVTNNKFRGTSGAPIFCLDNAHLTVTGNQFDNENQPEPPVGFDLINCDGSIEENTINGYQIGIKIFSSDILITANTLTDNQIGIKVHGSTGICPTVESNSYINNAQDLDYSESDCPYPENP